MLNKFNLNRFKDLEMRSDFLFGTCYVHNTLSMHVVYTLPDTSLEFV